jgi:4-hydroxy-tetrahydrodipicolinate synthase
MKYRKSEAKEYAREHLRGLWAATLTPFKPDDLSLDEAGFRRNFRHWVDDLNLGGLFVTGKQGEFFSMSIEERKRTFEIAVEECGDKAGTILSTSDENLDTVIDLSRHAHAIGADYVIVHSPPLYFHTRVDDILYEYYRYLSEQLDIGIAIWHQPDYGYVMSPELCARIAELPNIVAIKYSVPRELYTELTRLAGDKLIVSTSSEDHWLDNIVELGWQVYLCSTPPYLMQTATDQRMREYTELAMAGEVDKARAVRDSLDPVRKALKGTRPADKPQAQQKYWQDLIGQVGGPVRRPLLALTEAEKATIKSAVDACGLDLGTSTASAA